MDRHLLETSTGRLSASSVVTTAGLYVGTLAHKLGVGEGYEIVPFRGEYYELVPEKRHLVRSMIYPTPDPDLPFLGVHYTRRTDDTVIIGPTAVLAVGREAYENIQFDVEELAATLGYEGFWKLFGSRKMIRSGLGELNKSFRTEVFVRAAKSLVPEVESEDFRKSYAGIRAQIVSSNGTLVRDPLVEHGQRSTHVLNAVSAGLPSSLPFGEYLADEVLEQT